MREGSSRVTSWPEMLSGVFVIMLIGFASSGIIAGYLVQEHLPVAELSSLLNGFAPLIGFGILLIISALLFVLLICSMERMLADEDDGSVSEPHLKSRWHHVAPCPHDQLTHCLSLKEHSPPAFLFS